MTPDGASSYVNRGGSVVRGSEGGGCPGPGSDFSFSVLNSVLDVTDAGVVTKGGESSIHLKPRQSAQIPISAISGIADPGGDGTGDISTSTPGSDGTLAVLAMSATWTCGQRVGADLPVRMTLDYTFSNVGDPVVIERPAQIWTTFASEAILSTASRSRPIGKRNRARAGRSPTSSSAPTAWRACTSTASRPTAPRSSSGTSAYVDDLKRSKTKAKVTSNKAATVDGSRARRASNGRARHKGDAPWTISMPWWSAAHACSLFEYSSLEKTTKADRDLFDAFLKSVTRYPARAPSPPGRPLST